MRRQSFSLGEIFGVELRLHTYTLILLPLLALLAVVQGVSVGRGVMLLVLLLLAIVVRESLRALGMLFAGIHPTRLVITPIGALASFATRDAEAAAPRWLALLGPIANFMAAIVMAMLAFAVTSHLNFFDRPLAGPAHLLRAAVWIEIMLGGLHLLPALPLDAGQLLRSQFVRAKGEAAGTRAAAGISQAVGLGVIIFGGATQETMLMLLGGTVLLLAQLEGQQTVAHSAASSLTVKDVMLSEWTSLSGSDTVREALERSTHSLQETFPVLRGPVIVGSVTRTALLSALRAEGDGYVQGAMSRDLAVAAPDDSLLTTVERLAGSAARGNIVPVLQNGNVIGLITPQNLSPALLSLGRARRHLVRTAASDGDRNA